VRTGESKGMSERDKGGREGGREGGIQSEGGRRTREELVVKHIALLSVEQRLLSLLYQSVCSHTYRPLSAHTSATSQRASRQCVHIVFPLPPVGVAVASV
jgi:hypothetical protein